MTEVEYLKPSDGLTPLMKACLNDDERAITDILKDNPSAVDEVDEFGQTPLHYCTENISIKSAGLVLKPVLETKDVLGRTALHLSVIAGNVPMVKFLIGKKANVNVQDGEGHSGVHFATVCGHLELIDVLKGAKADMFSPDVHSASPLHYAVQLCSETENNPEKAKNAESVLNKLIQLYKPSRIDCVDEFQRTPLMWAASTV